MVKCLLKPGHPSLTALPLSLPTLLAGDTWDRSQSLDGGSELDSSSAAGWTVAQTKSSHHTAYQDNCTGMLRSLHGRIGIIRPAWLTISTEKSNACWGGNIKSWLDLATEAPEPQGCSVQWVFNIYMSSGAASITQKSMLYAHAKVSLCDLDPPVSRWVWKTSCISTPT